MYAVKAGPGSQTYIEDLKQVGFSSLDECVKYYEAHGWRMIGKKNDFAQMGIFLKNDDGIYNVLYGDLPNATITIGKDSLALWSPF